MPLPKRGVSEETTNIKVPSGNARVPSGNNGFNEQEERNRR